MSGAAKLIGIMIQGKEPIEQLILSGVEVCLVKFHRAPTHALVNSEVDIAESYFGVEIIKSAYIPYKTWVLVGYEQLRREVEVETG